MGSITMGWNYHHSSHIATPFADAMVEAMRKQGMRCKISYNDLNS